MVKLLGRSESTSPALVAEETEPVVAVTPPRRRRVSLMVLGSLLVVVAALVAAWLVASASETHRVLVTKGVLTPGVEVTDSDFVVVEVSGALDVSSVAADNQAQVVGRYPVALVPAGTLVNQAMFIERGDVIANGKTVVGAVVDPGQLPVNGVLVGDEVVLISTLDADQGAEPLELGVATVFSLSDLDGRFWVALEVRPKMERAVAAAAASGDLSLGLRG